MKEKLVNSVQEFTRSRYLTPAGWVIKKPDNSLVVNFRGSQFQGDFSIDGKITPSEMNFGDSKIKVHSGFKEGYNIIKENLEKTIEKVKDPETKEILYTGHSMGAAMAQIAALDAKAKPTSDKEKADIKVITTASPRVFYGEDSANFYNQVLGESSMRIVIKGDLIPSLPPKSIGYFHCGYKLEIKDSTRSYWSHGEYDKNITQISQNQIKQAKPHTILQKYSEIATKTITSVLYKFITYETKLSSIG